MYYMICHILIHTRRIIITNRHSWRAQLDPNSHTDNVLATEIESIKMDILDHLSMLQTKVNIYLRFFFFLLLKLIQIIRSDFIFSLRMISAIPRECYNRCGWYSSRRCSLLEQTISNISESTII